MTTQPDAEEMRVRDSLRDLGVSHTPVPPEEDWWFALYGEQPERERSAPGKPEPKKGDDDSEEWEEVSDPGDPATIEKRAALPRAVRARATQAAQQPLALFQGLERRMQWTISTGAGAALGWGLGLEQVLRSSLADCQVSTGNQVAADVVGVAMICIGGWICHRTSTWWPPLAWVCRMPFASALLAFLLFAPGASS